MHPDFPTKRSGLKDFHGAIARANILSFSDQQTSVLNVKKAFLRWKDKALTSVPIDTQNDEMRGCAGRNTYRQ